MQTIKYIRGFSYQRLGLHTVNGSNRLAFIDCDPARKGANLKNRLYVAPKNISMRELDLFPAAADAVDTEYTKLQFPFAHWSDSRDISGARDSSL